MYRFQLTITSAATVLLCSSRNSFEYQAWGFPRLLPPSKRPQSGLHAKPNRLHENVEGVVYVNDRCINCAACSSFSPEVFQRSDSAHVVFKQPTNDEEISKARAALAACPVAAIRLETLAERRHAAAPEAKAAVEEAWSEADEWVLQNMSPRGDARTSPFPRPFLMNELSENDESIPGVYWVGHHNEGSFGAIPYLVQVRHNSKLTWVMIDTPKYSAAAVSEILSIAGEEPEYLFLTHVDDTADHGKWANRFQGLKQIFHSGDLGRNNWIGDKTLEDVEVLLSAPSEVPKSGTLTAYTLDGTLLGEDWQQPFERGELASDAVILHTPGHSPGSITLYLRRISKEKPGILFTGDTYAYTTSGGGKMTGFGRYGNNKKQQVDTLHRLSKLTEWDIIAPGHGHPRDYRKLDDATKLSELNVAQRDLSPFVLTS